MKLKRIVAIILALCMVFALAACGSKDRDIKKEQEELREQLEATPAPSDDNQVGESQGQDEPQIVMPTATSDDVELYLSKNADGSDCVVNVFGQRASAYSVDGDGNVLDKDGDFVIAADNVKPFAEIKKLNFSAHEYNATLVPDEEAAETDKNVTNVKQKPTNITILLSANVEDATNRVIILEVQNSKVADVRANANAKILADGAFNVDTDQIAIELSEAGTARITVTALSAGNTEIRAFSLSGQASARCVVAVENGKLQSPAENEADENVSEVIIATDDPTVHAHSYTKTVVAPTQYEKGYTEYTCACGHSYRDDYTSPLPDEPEAPEVHVHEYSASVVAPTETERGYTLHVCECGDSYKDSFVAPTGG